MWIEQDRERNREISLIRRSADGQISATVMSSPRQREVSEFYSALGCGNEQSFVSFINDAGMAQVFTPTVGEQAPALKPIGKIKTASEDAINRSMQVQDGSIYHVPESGRLIQVNFRDQSVTESVRLVPRGQRPVSVTPDGERIHVVAQRNDGPANLTAYSFQLGNLEPADSGFELVGLESMSHSDRFFNSPTAVTAAIYPVDKS